MQVYWSLLICLVGFVMYLVMANPPSNNVLQQKLSVVGLHMFWVGLLVFLLQAGAGTLTLLRK